MTNRISPVKAFFLAVGAMGLILILLIGAAYAYAKQRKREYRQLTDTRDLKERIHALGNEYVKGHQHASLMIAVSTRSNVYYQGFTVTGTNLPTRETIYEIGSITKVFTAVLLSKLEEDGMLSSSNRLVELLPPEVKPQMGYANVTLNHLATHTAGLPRLPENLLKLAKDQQNPYKDYTTNELYEAFAKAAPEQSPGAKLQYSNFGFGLLGHVLELKAAKSYATLIHDQITEPLGMKSSWMEIPTNHLARLVPGHDSKGNVVPYWDFQVMAPAGGLKSTAEDMIRFSRANLDKDLPLHSTCARAHKIRYRGLGGVVGWGWHAVRTFEDLDFLWHNGGTGGFVSFIGLDLRLGNSVVILSNSGDAFDLDGSVDKMGLELLKLATKISLE